MYREAKSEGLVTCATLMLCLKCSEHRAPPEHVLLHPGAASGTSALQYRAQCSIFPSTQKEVENGIDTWCHRCFLLYHDVWERCEGLTDVHGFSLWLVGVPSSLTTSLGAVEPQNMPRTFSSA